jgi:hypothetical protein
MKYFTFIFFVFTCYFSNSQRIVINPVCFNSTGNDFGVRKVGEKLYFVSDFPDSTLGWKRDIKSGDWFTNIYESNGCERKEAKLLKNGIDEMVTINSEWYDGPLTQSKKDSVLFFSNTSEGFQHGKMGIYYSKQLGDNSYTDPFLFPYNSVDYSCIHPYYDEANSQLYFSSDMGKDSIDFDLYRVNFDGTHFGALDTLKAVNSVANELFPYFYNGQLYLSSDRESGQGGLDIYSAELGSELKPLPAPFNSPYDDLAISFIEKNRGYFSSDRNGIEYNDDIFEFYVVNINKKVIVNEGITSLVRDLKGMLKEVDSNSTDGFILRSVIDKLKLQELLIQKLQQDIYANQERVMNTLDTSSFLTFDQSVNLYQQFIEESVLVDKHLYNDLPENTQDILSNRQIIESNIDAIVSTETDMINNKLIPFILDKQSEPIGTINELVSHYEMSDEMMSLIMANRYPLEFYFDFDHFELDEKEMLTLRKFITTAKGYNGKVKIEGYTDNTGSEKYNFKLSRKRAQFVADLLILEGFPSENIVIVAKGESDPIASNKTNEGRRKNRRGVLRID